MSSNKNYRPWQSIPRASSTFCVAINYGSQFSVFNGNNWSKPTPPWALDREVDCPTTSFCAGLGAFGEVFVGTDLDPGRLGLTSMRRSAILMVVASGALATLAAVRISNGHGT